MSFTCMWMHKELNRQHPTMDMDKYLLQHNKQPRICTEHDGQPINAGCKNCLKMICVKCLSAVTSCADGSAHELMSLDKLVAILNLEIDELKAKMVEKEGKLEQLFKCTSKTMSEFEEETKDLVEMIHVTRDKQIETLKLKYDKLEKELSKVRLRVKSQLAQFLEEKECDVVGGYKDTKSEIQKLVEDILSSLKVTEVNKLRRKDGSSDIQLELVSADGFLLDEQLKLSPFVSLPNSLKLLCTVKVQSYPCSVRKWNNQTFVGLENNKIASIDSSYQVNPSYLAYNNNPTAVEVHNDRWYTLVQGNPWKINVYDASEKLVASWDHNDTRSGFSGLAIVSEQVVAPDRANKSLHVYSLSGSLIKSISCSQLSDYWVSLCGLGADSVIVSDNVSSQVFRMNISTGGVMWTCKDVARPEGMTCYGERYIFVAAQGSRTLSILNGASGEIVSELTDNAICRSTGHVFDMDISGDILIAVDYNTKSVLYYQLLD